MNSIFYNNSDTYISRNINDECIVCVPESVQSNFEDVLPNEMYHADNNESDPPSISSDELTKPLQVGVLIIGSWGSTKKALQYLVLHLNTQQTLFEFQLFHVDSSCDVELIQMLERDDNTRMTFHEFIHGPVITHSKNDLKENVNSIAQLVYDYYSTKYPNFDHMQLPRKFVFLSPFKHIDPKLFQVDGNRAYSHSAKYIAGGVIFTGNHKDVWNPPSVIEFVYKFLIRISVRWLIPEFGRKHKHMGQKGCLFDSPHKTDICLIRNMVLLNFICQHCTRVIGEENKKILLDALDMKQLYSEDIDTHPAKICHRLGFHLSFTKGIYQTKCERIRSILSEAFFGRVGTILAACVFGVIIIPLGFKEIYLSE